MNRFFNMQETENDLLLYIKEADRGSKVHQEKLGIYYWIKADLKNTEKYLKMAAEGGSVSAMIMLSVFYKNPPVIMNVEDYQDCDFEAYHEDCKKSFYWVKRSAEAGDKFSMYEIAQEYRNNPETEKEAFEWYQKSADLGCVSAMNDVGAAYEFGMGVEVDYEKSFNWYMKAAKLGCRVGLYNVGQCYRTGRGVAKNPRKAFDYYKKSAEKGKPNACNEVGCYLNENIYIERNPYEAYKWFKIGACLGNKNSLYNLASCYEKGTGVEVNYKKALLLYYRISNFKNPQKLVAAAINKVGIFLSEGYGVEKNPKEAVLWFKRSANMDYPYAMLNLSEHYEKGEGIRRNLKMAEKLKKQAEEMMKNEEN